MNWTVLQFGTVHSNGIIHSARTVWALNVFVSLQPIKSLWLGRLAASQSSLFSSVQFMRHGETLTGTNISCKLARLLWLYHAACRSGQSTMILTVTADVVHSHNDHLVGWSCPLHSANTPPALQSSQYLHSSLNSTRDTQLSAAHNQHC